MECFLQPPFEIRRVSNNRGVNNLQYPVHLISINALIELTTSVLSFYVPVAPYSPKIFLGFILQVPGTNLIRIEVSSQSSIHPNTWNGSR